MGGQEQSGPNGSAEGRIPPAFVGTVENIDDDWKRFQATFSDECAIANCEPTLDHRHDHRSFSYHTRSSLTESELALVQSTYSGDITLHRVALELSRVLRVKHTITVTNDP